jgi:uncharacterized membrane protein required for colicin V production
MGVTDIVLAAIMVAAFIVGFFWGARRSVFLIAAWVAAFVAAAHLRVSFGSYLARQWDQFTPAFNLMAAFGLIYVGLLLFAPVAIYVWTTGGHSVSRSQTLDDISGAFIALAVAVLGIAGTMAVLSTYYGAGGSASGGPTWTAALHDTLQASRIGAAIDERLVPLIAVVLRIVLPPDVVESMS